MDEQAAAIRRELDARRERVSMMEKVICAALQKSLHLKSRHYFAPFFVDLKSRLINLKSS